VKKPTNTTAEAERDPLGFLVDAMALGGSGAIKRQELHGQHELVKSDTLPSEMAPDTRAMLEKAGVKFLDPVEGDPLFVYAKLPDGWSKRATGHSMHSKLVDDRGRERASIFYKAAFYDRSASLTATSRYGCRVDYDRLEKTGECVAEVVDGDAVIFSTAPRAKTEARWECTSAAIAEARAWLAERFPQWTDPSAYWDEP
jgi:hypothetical protein